MMATLNLDILTNVNANRTNSTVYKDANIDFTLDHTYNNQLAKTLQITDLNSDDNLGALFNSISNIITPTPGQKPLNPLFGISFRDLLFLPVSKDRARLIGNAINFGIETFEPRVNIINISITPKEEDQQYVIELSISVPRFNVQQVKVSGVLDKTGFYKNN